MKVTPEEVLFIRTKAPYGMMRTLGINIGMPYTEVRKHFITLKEEYPDKLINEARRLLKANTGLEYKPVQEVA